MENNEQKNWFVLIGKEILILLGMCGLWIVPQFGTVLLDTLISNEILLVVLQLCVFTMGVVGMILWAKKLKMATFKWDWLTRRNIGLIVLMFVVGRIVAIVLITLNGEPSANDTQILELPMNKVVIFTWQSLLRL